MASNFPEKLQAALALLTYTVMSSAVIVDRINDGVDKILLNRPHALNSINCELLDGLVSALDANQSSRVITLGRAGKQAFCTGEDLKRSLVQKPGSRQKLNMALDKLQNITRLTAKPMFVAAVQGVAIIGGAEIALAVEFVIGGPGAQYRFPEVTVGHAGYVWYIFARLPHLVGLLKPKVILITARWIYADGSLSLGLLAEIAADPKKRALELAVQLSKRQTMAASKVVLERATLHHTEDCLPDEGCVASHCFAQQDADNVVSNFVARKSPGSQSRNINGACARAVEKFPTDVFFCFGGRDITFFDFDGVVSRLAGSFRKP